MIRVLVCGGRDFNDCSRVRSVLEWVKDVGSGIAIVIEGGAAGADSSARKWAKLAGVRSHSFAANWRSLGRAAGPERNQRMLDEGKPDVVVAFAGGRGTADMVRRAEKAGVLLLDLREPRSEQWWSDMRQRLATTTTKQEART